MSITRSAAAVLLALALALAGCGSPEAGSENTPTSAVPTLGSTTPPTDEVCGSHEEPSGSATVKHAMGSTTVPEDPQRIVILDSDKFDSLCALGLADKVVGAIEIEGGQPTYLGPTLANVPTIGTIQEPSVEKIAALKPDLIIGSKFRTPDLYAPLSKIAPTVFTENVGSTWKENFLLDGQALRRGDQAKQLLSTYEQQAEKVGQEVNGAGADASIVRFLKGTIRVYGPTSFSGLVLEDAGISRPEFQRLEGEEDRRFTEVSQEEINLVDGKIIYVSAYGEESNASRDEMLQSSLWKTLQASKDGKVYIVKDETWMTGIGVVAAGAILEDLKTSLG